jgi:N-acetylglucosaminyl-diphospho-decaprenol L-rhamnosyltransferase
MELRSWGRPAAIPIATLPDPENGTGSPVPAAADAAARPPQHQQPAIAGLSSESNDPTALAPVVITVAYRSGEALPRLAADLAGQSLRPTLWLLVDNAPASAPLDLQPLQAAAATGRSPSVRAPLPLSLLRGHEGDGFGAGCNRALDALAAAGWNGWVWLLNPDTGLPDGREVEQLSALLPTLPQTALLGTAVTDEHGALEASGGWIGRGLAFRARRLGEANARGDTPVAVDWLSGCSLLLRPAAQPAPPRFDPRFPLYYEDMDLCLRLAGRGAPMLWLPLPRLLHRRGSGSETAGARRLRLSTLSYLRFLQRHCPAWVFVLRSLRLLLLNVLRLPLRPRRSAAVLAAAGSVLGESLRRTRP